MPCLYSAKDGTYFYLLLVIVDLIYT